MKMALRHMVPVVFNTLLLFNPVRAFADGDTDKVRLDFFFNKSDSVFNPSNFRNRESLDSLHYLMNKNLEFKDVTVAGFASPEGDSDFNQRIARARAYSLYSYILQFPDLTSGNITILPGKVDWNGLSHLSDEETKNLEENVYPRQRRAELSFHCSDVLSKSVGMGNNGFQHREDDESLYVIDSQQNTPPDWECRFRI